MLRYTYVFIFLITRLSAYAQDLIITPLEDREKGYSYFDIARVNHEDAWMVGSSGSIRSINRFGHIISIRHPGPLENLLKIEKFGKDRLIICGDKGVLFIYDQKQEKWEITRIEGYEKYCFYDICIRNDSTALMCGGKSEISVGKRTIPRGFILKTIDRGVTWTKVYGNTTNMIWSIKEEKENKTIVAIIYSPFGSKIISSTDQGLTWNNNSKRIRALFHDMSTQGEFIFVGARKNKLHSDGLVVTFDNEFDFKDIGFVFGITANSKYTVATTANGFIVIKTANQPWQLIHTGNKVSLYEALFMDQNTFYVIGSRNTILRVDIHPIQPNHNFR